MATKRSKKLHSIESRVSRAQAVKAVIGNLIAASIDDSQQSSGLHLHLHGAAPFERGSAADDQSEVVGP